MQSIVLEREGEGGEGKGERTKHDDPPEKNGEKEGDFPRQKNWSSNLTSSLLHIYHY